MKIRGTCRHCGRDFLAEQVGETGGKCPSCGKPFQYDYAAVLVDVLRQAEAAGNTLESALEKTADLQPGFVLDIDSVMTKMRSDLERLERLHSGK